MTIYEDFVIEADADLIKKGVPLHARPFHVAMAWMKFQNISGDILDPKIWTPLRAIYGTLYPSGDFTMPSMLVGGVALRDQMYAAKVNVGYGTFKIEPLKCIDISEQELALVFKLHPDQGWRALYAVADLWDIAYSIDDLLKNDDPASEMMVNARSSIASTTRTLMSSIDIDSAVQSSCLTAELSMKAVLTHLGTSKARLLKLGHNLVEIAKELETRTTPSTEASLLSACGKFPNYVGTRYSSHGLTRQQLMELGMRAQFVAANALRRISDRNLAGQIESQAGNPPRAEI